MNDHAYDISYLLESESVVVEAPVPRIVKTPPAPQKSSIADTQEAMARELLQAAGAHEELIQQYLRMGGGTLQDSSRY